MRRRFEGSDIVNSVTALHRLARSTGYDDFVRDPMLLSIMERLEVHMAELKVQQLANTAWAVARIIVFHEPLLDALAASALKTSS
jgi:hypothetical protein